MNIGPVSKPEEYTIVVGCGRLGANLANTLSDLDGNVLIIDKDPESFRKLSPSYGGMTLTGDAANLQVLGDANIEKATTVVSVTNNDNINILVAQLAKELFHTDRVVARLYDPERECVYREFGIATIFPAVLSAKEIEKLLNITAGEEEEE